MGNIQKSIPASFVKKVPPMVRKIAVRRSAQVRSLKGMFFKVVEVTVDGEYVAYH